MDNELETVAVLKAEIGSLGAVIDQQKAKLIDRSNQLCKLEHDLRNSRLAVTGYREITQEAEREVQRLRKELEDALREIALLKDDLKRAGVGNQGIALVREPYRPPVDLFAPSRREEDIPPYTQMK